MRAKTTVLNLDEVYIAIRFSNNNQWVLRQRLGGKERSHLLVFLVSSAHHPVLHTLKAQAQF
ncbi:MAG: hypothetical protein HWQ35_33865 [Nostoc sp. NMS1]|uniref:hypothetical protein n=1 Tax=unclassified Nostoc TaxID=2593658 RepID=UPI0025E17592|nr:MULTISPECIES: hypothetical protein [unclassified Nostoc]MBN3911344.1 hypothetical protein [Nostoc sp. NMS1]MBN3995088.1 hypothetical protein [Nostoc sp. NMS2]